MATLELSASPASYDDGDGYRSILVRAMDRVGHAQTAEVKNIADVKAAVQRFGAQIAANHAGVSFIVHVFIQRGSRKPRGFDAARVRNGLGTENWLEKRVPPHRAASIIQEPLESPAA